MDSKEGSRDSKDALFGSQPGLSTGVSDQLAGIQVTSQSGLSVPIDSDSRGKRKMVDRVAQRKKPKVNTVDRLVDAVSIIANVTRDRCIALNEIQDRGVEAIVANLQTLEEVATDEEFCIKCIEILIES